MRRAGAQAGLVAAALALALARAAVGQEAPELRPLRVAIVAAPPFVIPAAAEGWQGVSLDLWDALARAEGWTYSVLPADIEAALDALREAGAAPVRCGQVVAGEPGRVTLRTPFGTARALDLLAGDQLPRIC